VLLLAHAGHILIDAPLFLAPALILGGALWMSARKEKQRQKNVTNGHG
jgi:hypothetical protein